MVDYSTIAISIFQLFLCSLSSC